MSPVDDGDVWPGVPTLLIEFSTDSDSSDPVEPDPDVSVSVDGETVFLEVDDVACELTRDAAGELREAIDDALTTRREFLRTAGAHREDGSYVVSRRGADSAGNRKVFHGFDELRRLYDRLPETFTAAEIGRSGITGSRRHMIVRHLCEHPAFDCEIATRNPLTGRKRE